MNGKKKVYVPNPEYCDERWLDEDITGANTQVVTWKYCRKCCEKLGIDFEKQKPSDYRTEEQNEKIKERNDEIEKLYIKHSKELMNFALSRRFSEKEAEDIVQEAFITLIKKYNIAEIKNPRAWLYKTVEYIILNKAKTEKHHLSTEQDVEPTSDGGIEIYIATSSVLETIKKALTDKEFELFSDYFFIQGNGKNDFKTSTERSRISRIKDKVRKALKENGCVPEHSIYENNASAVCEGNNSIDESGVSTACEGDNFTDESDSESYPNESDSDNSSSKEGATV
jgi:hypothetical protein